MADALNGSISEKNLSIIAACDGIEKHITIGVCEKCYIPFQNGFRFTKCKHEFCLFCLDSAINTSNLLEIRCPNCKIIT